MVVISRLAVFFMCCRGERSATVLRLSRVVFHYESTFAMLDVFYCGIFFKGRLMELSVEPGCVVRRF